MKTQVGEIEFKLQLDAEGLPYVLKRWQWNEPRSRRYWATVWANWHKGLPTGTRMQAIEALGFKWNQLPVPHWERLDRTN